MVKDHLSNFIVQLQNAGRAGKPTVSVPYSKLISAVADVLHKEGYLATVERHGRKIGKYIEVTLAFNERKQPKINGVQRISKPSRRVYTKSTRLHPVLNGLGRMIVSTPKGIMTNITARKQKVGGELLFKIW